MWLGKATPSRESALNKLRARGNRDSQYTQRRGVALIGSIFYIKLQQTFPFFLDIFCSHPALLTFNIMKV